MVMVHLNTVITLYQTVVGNGVASGVAVGLRNPVANARWMWQVNDALGTLTALLSE